jgi:GntR family transcriptional regulator
MDLDDLPKVRSTRDQLEAALSQLVQRQRPGDQLPPEPVLARQLGVSRPTLREMLRTFADRGLLVRRQGVGTFVASRLPVLDTGLEVLESLDRMTEHLGLSTEMAHLTIVERPATELELEYLGRSGPTEVLAVDRVIAIEGEPVADLTDVVPVEYLRRTDLDDEFRGSVLDLLLARGSPPLSHSRTEILAELAAPVRNGIPGPESRAERLGVEPGAPLLLLVAQLYSYDECVVDYSVSAFVPGHFRFHVMRQVRS